ncbi:ArsR family transcriptional regulator [Rubripirellula amarantea]|nr:ArsR family transcriptional regulator [Rubripirellula amarantea]MDA8743190.1 ArsR family transcriptional regulator [Rubripirellula amarantea]
MTNKPRTVVHEELRSVDRELLLAMRSGDAFDIGDLTESLGVTATAVRQRVERLLERGCLVREKVVSGRGRPTYRYIMTLEGHRRAGANPADLADSMWRTIIEIEDEELRESLLQTVATKLGQRFANVMDAHRSETQSEVTSLQHRFDHLSEVMASNHIAASVSCDGNLPVLDIESCPYPSLTEASDDRAMCKLEEKMLSEALGHPVHLSSCRLDGDQCCQFSAGPIATAIADTGQDNQSSTATV